MWHLFNSYNFATSALAEVCPLVSAIIAVSHSCGLLHCALSLAAQCIVIGPVCGHVCNGWAGRRCLLPR